MIGHVVFWLKRETCILHHGFKVGTHSQALHNVACPHPFSPRLAPRNAFSSSFAPPVLLDGTGSAPSSGMGGVVSEGEIDWRMGISNLNFKFLFVWRWLFMIVCFRQILIYTIYIHIPSTYYYWFLLNFTSLGETDWINRCSWPGLSIGAQGWRCWNQPDQCECGLSVFINLWISQELEMMGVLVGFQGFGT